MSHRRTIYCTQSGSQWEPVATAHYSSIIPTFKYPISSPFCLSKRVAKVCGRMYLLFVYYFVSCFWLDVTHVQYPMILSLTPSSNPTESPSLAPSNMPTSSHEPSIHPTFSQEPSRSLKPNAQPSSHPSFQPSSKPKLIPPPLSSQGPVISASAGSFILLSMLAMALLQ